MIDQNIFLIGFMGAGKTSVGKKLAKKMGLTFIDLDEALIIKFGISINEYFAKFGEESFRDEETKMLKETISDLKINNETGVISTGGGLPCFNSNMEQMNKNGVTIYLERPAKELFHRLVNNRSKRPLLLRLNEDELLQFITDSLEKRKLFYRQAKLILNREEQGINDIVKRLQ